jgi:hypothetical protein
MTDRRTPPHDHVAEAALIGIAMLDNTKVAEIIPIIDPPDFYLDKNRIIWETIITLTCAGQEASAATIHRKLGDTIPVSYISGLTDAMPRGQDAVHYSKIVRDMSRRRKVIEAAARLAGAAQDGDMDTVAHTITDLASRKIMSKRDKTITDEIRKFISVTSGEFTVRDLYNSLDSVSPKDKNNVRQIVHTMKNEGVIEPSGGRDGVYRRIEHDLEVMDFINAPTEGLSFDWPLDLHEIATIFPRDIICFAGAQNAGKTAIAVDFIRRNMDKCDIHYFNCEMSSSRLRDRLSKVDDMPLDAWKFKAYTRSEDFADVIQPNSVNVIDYLEIVDNYWEVAKKLKDIFKKLDQGIAIVMIQKDEFRDTGRGGSMGLEKPSLYVAINHGKAKLVKVKSWKGEDNPNKKVVEFKLVHGWKFVPQGHWHSEEADEAMKNSAGYGKRKLF